MITSFSSNSIEFDSKIEKTFREQVRNYQSKDRAQREPAIVEIVSKIVLIVTQNNLLILELWLEIIILIRRNLKN